MPVTITAKKDGFRRCGVGHPATAVEHPDGRFSAAELARLKAEPMLVVHETAAKTATKADDKTKPQEDKK